MAGLESAERWLMVDGTLIHLLIGFISTQIGLMIFDSRREVSLYALSIWVVLELTQMEVLRRVDWIDSVHDIGMSAIGLTLRLTLP